MSVLLRTTVGPPLPFVTSTVAFMSPAFSAVPIRAVSSFGMPHLLIETKSKLWTLQMVMLVNKIFIRYLNINSTWAHVLELQSSKIFVDVSQGM